MYAQHRRDAGRAARRRHAEKGGVEWGFHLFFSALARLRRHSPPFSARALAPYSHTYHCMIALNAAPEPLQTRRPLPTPALWPKVPSSAWPTAPLSAAWKTCLALSHLHSTHCGTMRAARCRPASRAELACFRSTATPTSWSPPSSKPKGTLRRSVRRMVFLMRRERRTGTPRTAHADGYPSSHLPATTPQTPIRATRPRPSSPTTKKKPNSCAASKKKSKRARRRWLLR